MVRRRIDYNSRTKELTYLKNALLLAILAVGLVGCQNSVSPLVGTWKMTANGAETGMTSTFTGDGKVTTTATIPAATPPVSLNISGTYTLEKDSLTLNYTEVNFTNLPAALKAQEAQFKQQILANQASSKVSTVKWDGNDSFSVATPDGQTATFSRQK